MSHCAKAYCPSCEVTLEVIPCIGHFSKLELSNLGAGIQASYISYVLRDWGNTEGQVLPWTCKMLAQTSAKNRCMQLVLQSGTSDRHSQNAAGKNDFILAA